MVISLMLGKMGADVTIVENGQSADGRALQAQEEGNPFNLILMDIRMPVMDGCLATRQLREAGCRLPIVAMTAHAMSGTVRNSSRLVATTTSASLLQWAS